MRLTTTSVSEHLVLRLHGELRADDAPELRRRIGSAVAHDPHDLVICDLSGVRRADPLAVRVFATHQEPERGPGPALCLVGARGEVAEVLGRLGIERFLPVASTVEAALALTRSMTPRLCAVRSLVKGPSAPRLARRFVRETCTAWGATSVVEDAELVAAELVTNAVMHAGTDVVLRLERTTDRLMVAVRDTAEDAFSPWWHGSDEVTEPMAWGHGLTLVRAVAESAGVHHDPTGGKAVWAILRAEPATRLSARPRRVRLTVNAGRVGQRDEARWQVRLDLVWVPDRPELVELVLTSRPRHPSLPRGSWSVARSTLRDGLEGPVRYGSLRVWPERGGRELVVETGDPAQVLRVSASRVRGFLESTEESTGPDGNGQSGTADVTAPTGTGP